MSLTNLKEYMHKITHAYNTHSLSAQHDGQTDLLSTNRHWPALWSSGLTNKYQCFPNWLRLSHRHTATRQHNRQQNMIHHQKSLWPRNSSVKSLRLQHVCVESVKCLLYSSDDHRNTIWLQTTHILIVQSVWTAQSNQTNVQHATVYHKFMYNHWTTGFKKEWQYVMWSNERDLTCLCRSLELFWLSIGVNHAAYLSASSCLP